MLCACWAQTPDPAKTWNVFLELINEKKASKLILITWLSQWSLSNTISRLGNHMYWRYYLSPSLGKIYVGVCFVSGFGRFRCLSQTSIIKLLPWFSFVVKSHRRFIRLFSSEVKWIFWYLCNGWKEGLCHDLYITCELIRGRKGRNRNPFQFVSIQNSKIIFHMIHMIHSHKSTLIIILKHRKIL